MITYIKNIVWVMALLALAAVGMAWKLDLYHWSLGLGVVIFMGLNALAAVYPLYRFHGNPFNIYVGSMMVRLAVIGAVLILIITLTELSKAHLLSMTLTAMGSFVAYLGVEVRHFLKHTAFTTGSR